MSAIFKHAFHRVGGVLCVATLLASCASAEPKKPEGLGASIRAINYSSKEVELTVMDPLDKSNRGGGDALNPYGMGGTICCFRIPAKWHSGYQVIVKYSFYPEETWHEQVVDVPPYAEGIAGDIWLAMHDDGRAEVVVSKFGPTRTEWLGRVKGRPVRSAEYVDKLKNDQLATKRGMLQTMERGLDDGTARSPERTKRLKASINLLKEEIHQMEMAQP